MWTRLSVIVALSALVLGCTEAAEPTAAPAAPLIRVEALMVTPTPGGRDISAGYMTVRNSGAAPDVLVGVASPSAGRVDIHETRLGEGGVMQMFPIAQVPVPADGEVAFAPGGLHLMLMDLHAPLAEGERVRMTFTFERSGAVELEAQVARPGGAAHGH